MLADVEYYDVAYKYEYSQWVQPTLGADFSTVDHFYSSSDWPCYAPNTGSHGFYVDEGYGEHTLQFNFDEDFIPSSFYYRIASGWAAASGSYNNRFWALTQEGEWQLVTTFPNTGEGWTVHYDLSEVAFPARSFRWTFGNGGHSYEDALTIYAFRVSGRIRRLAAYDANLWSQPILHANGTMGVDNFAVSTNVPQISTEDAQNLYLEWGQTYDVYKAFNGSNISCFHSAINETTGHIDMYSKTPIKVTKINIFNHAYHQTNPVDNRASAAGKIYGSNNGTTWTELKSYTNDVQTANAKWTIDLSSNTKYYNYYRMESTANGGAEYWTIGAIELIASQNGVSNTAGPDLILTKARASLPYSTTRKYYKYKNVSWTQPILTGPTFTDFIPSTNVDQYDPANNQVWKLFDGSNSTLFHSKAGANKGFIEWWSKTALRVTHLHIINQAYANRAAAAGKIMGSDDGEIWESVGTYANTVQASAGEWDIDLSSNTKYFNYYRFYCDTPGPDGSYWTMAEMQITADGRDVIDGTKSNYDFYIDSNDYKAVKHYKKGQVLCKS